MSYQHPSPNSSTVDSVIPIDRLFVDLDGCVFNNLNRKVGVPTDPFDQDGWDKFQAACNEDEVIQQVADIIRHYVTTYKCQLIFVSARTADVVEKTVIMLNHHVIPDWDGLFLKPAGDNRFPWQFKKQTFRELGLCSGDLVIDDCPETIKMVMEDFPEASVMYCNFGLCQSKIQK